MWGQSISFTYTQKGNLSNRQSSECTIAKVQTQEIALNEGWNLASTFLQPQNAATGPVFSSIGEELLKVKNLFQSYDPTFPEEFNTLKSLTDGQGYWVRVSEADTWTVQGTQLDPGGVLIPLKTGWNLIGCTCSSPQAPAEAFQLILNDVEKVKNIFESYDPNLDPVFNTLNTIEPGQGYWIKVKNDIDFYYNCSSNNISELSAELKTEEKKNTLPKEWQAKKYTNSTIAYGEVTLNGQPIQNGTIGAFVKGECRAVGTIQELEEKGIVSLVVNGETSEKVEFRLWYDYQEYISELNWSSSPGQFSDDLLPLAFGAVTSTGSAVLENQIQIFPNPTSGELIFVTQLEQSQNIQVALYSLDGRQLFIGPNQTQPAGKSRFSMDLSNAGLQLQKGIYLLKVYSGKNVLVKKIIVQ
jgi:hypothetical protein